MPEAAAVAALGALLFAMLFALQHVVCYGAGGGRPRRRVTNDRG